MSEIAVDNGLLNQVARDVRTTMNMVNAVNAQVLVVQGQVKQTEERVAKLRKFVEDMRREQRNAAALQRALTEIIRVRQELEQKFGKYQQVRDTMMGIVTSTDTALVTKETISRVSEELMVGTPNYWLAPCVIAIAAWIADDRDLANRAIDEGMHRDEQKTALLMALICRRNHRYVTSKKWLTHYFECQDATNISRSVLLFVNAYANGIFDANGEQCDNQSDEFIRNVWLRQLENSNPNFKSEQEAYWTNRFCAQASQAQGQVVGSYRTLAKVATHTGDFASAIAYLTRITASEKIAADFSSILDYKVDPKVIEAQIEQYLKDLITDFDEAEFSLREEEEEFTAIKEAKGDEAIAKKKIQMKKARKILLAQKLSLIQYLNDTISGKRVDDIGDTTGKTPEQIAKMQADHAAEIKSEQRLSLKFTKTYVQESYDNFIAEKAAAYPQQMRAKVEDVEHPIKTEEDKKTFAERVRERLYSRRDAEIAAVKNISSFVWMGVGVAALIVFLIAQVIPLAIIGCIAGVLIGVFSLMGKKKKREQIAADYEKRLADAIKLINAAVDEWLAMNRKVATFNSVEKFDITTKI